MKLCLWHLARLGVEGLMYWRSSHPLAFMRFRFAIVKRDLCVVCRCVGA